jgi:MFS family permease
MRFLEIILVMVGALVLFAPITGYIAASYGRSFWRWYLIGLLLPFVSMFVAIFMAIRSRMAEEKAGAHPLPKPPAEE